MIQLFESDASGYIVLDIPSPMAEEIRALRDHFDPNRAALPAEITLTGSCGLGLVQQGQDPDMICGEIDRIAAETAPFEAKFSNVKRFENTDIYFLTLNDETPFLALHQKFAHSKIRFGENSFPYMPHCTLKLRSTPTEPELLELLFLNPPKDSFLISGISMYTLTADRANCELLYHAELTGRC